MATVGAGEGVNVTAFVGGGMLGSGVKMPKSSTVGGTGVKGAAVTNVGVTSNVGGGGLVMVFVGVAVGALAVSVA